MDFNQIEKLNDDILEGLYEDIIGNSTLISDCHCYTGRGYICFGVQYCWGTGAAHNCTETSGGCGYCGMQITRDDMCREICYSRGFTMNGLNSYCFCSSSFSGPLRGRGANWDTCNR